MMPSFDLELSLSPKIVAGLDEVGRGPWAGPVMACAVVLDIPNTPSALLDIIRDSKKMSARNREYVYKHLINATFCSHGLGEANPQEIDQINILQATYLAMSRALGALPRPIDTVLVDGRAGLKAPLEVIPVIKGDSLSYSIAAASIIAKVTRDRYMTELAQAYPMYGWERNAGYGTELHRQGIDTHGITPHHRQSFGPIKARIHV